ncbi:nuclease SbcCD, D subunit [Thermodesulfobium narugense DSM 14796]|uniref:Nuclease SbcCD subunit D n=1 Tax=Thermodesulfobium narugense DSM 14796 TaxID=747365 RepID=M1E463_9BACT|nr:exonuclease SbcCD subunit D C-terminal domain-containing protein [Thermodesulfobium narugense]AEE13742.1 nuclease SbcCD, D subunit [Thermodesulfobium narugense DSM 14796]
MNKIKPLRVLHTSDWHIGDTICSKRRYDEFELALNWLYRIVEEKDVDIVLISGDIFNTSTPSSQAQELYYRFLHNISKSRCKHVVITAGNHDSPSFLSAPKEILKALNVHVIGSISDKLEDEVMVLKDNENIPILIVCAVPYLREKDITFPEEEEIYSEREIKIINAIKKHYDLVFEIAKNKKTELGLNIPIVVMGHLFLNSAILEDNDGVRDLYVGSLCQIPVEFLPHEADYIALGHLHTPQSVSKNEKIRYSGSLLPMNFKPYEQKKTVFLAQFYNGALNVESIEIPKKKELISLSGSFEEIKQKIENLSLTEKEYYLEVIYSGEEIVPNLKEKIEDLPRSNKIEILKIKNNRLNRSSEDDSEAIDIDLSLDLFSIFERCLDENSISEEQKIELRNAFKEILKSMSEKDLLSENS